MFNRPEHRFCTQCGGRLLIGVAPVACRRCGAPNAAGTRFCTRCGAQFY
jgi:predicted amidophosphoribosyltransferase